MAKKKQYTASEFNKQAEQSTQHHKENLELIEEELSSLSSIFDIRLKMNNQNQKYNELVAIRNEKQNVYLEALKSGNKMHGNTKNAIKKNIAAHDKEIKSLEKKLKLYNNIHRTAELTKMLVTSFVDTNFLMAADGAIKSINLELGSAGHNAEILRSNIYQTASAAAQLGASTADLANIQRAFSEETGRAAALSSEMLYNVTAIGKGTALGVQQAGALAAKFELMGVYGTQTLEYVQGIVDSSERMGVNSTKVLKKLEGNFKNLQKYTFRGGVKAMAEMAQHAEKFNYDMSSMLDSANSARTLEGAVKLAAELQVMGGEFAKTDPFEILFLSRNDPDKFAKKINNMTKGIATFRKTSDGTFESFISPVDIDRLEKVGAQLGMDRGELVEQSRRMNEIQTMRQQMMGMGYSQKDKEIIEGFGKFNSDTGRYLIQVSGVAKDISSLTKDEIKLLTAKHKDLDARAKDAQTFDEAFQHTLNSLKSTLLPLLDGVNMVLGYIRPVMDGFSDIVNTFTNKNVGLMAGAGALMGVVLAWKKVITPVATILTKKSGINTLVNRAAGGATSSGGAASTLAGGKASKAAGIGKGVAGAGMGAGVGMAAAGIGLLASQMSKLDKTQIWALPATVLALAGAFWAMTPAVTALGTAGTAGSLGILALGGSIGIAAAGIGVAAAGIGYMSKGLGEMITAADNSEGSLFKLAGGLLAINGAMAMGGATALFGGAGLAVLAGTLSTIAKHSDKLENVGDAFKNISVVMNGDMQQLKELESTIQSLSKLNFDKSSGLSKLGELLKKPLKVEFTDKEVSLVTNLDVNIDGYQVARATHKHLKNITYTTKFAGTD